MSHTFASPYKPVDADLPDFFFDDRAATSETAPVHAVIPRGPDQFPDESREEYWKRLGVEARLDPEYAAVMDAPPSEAPARAQAPRALTEPEWTGGFRGQTAKLLWQRAKLLRDSGSERVAHRLERKAIRFLDCGKLGRPGVCSLNPSEHKFFVPHNCEVVFCKECADDLRRTLTQDYIAVVTGAISERGGLPKGWVLARVTFSLQSEGQEITPGRVKGMNQCVGSVMRQMVGSRKGFGFLYVDEVGFEKRGHLPDEQRLAHGLNLHCHGIYFGPYLDWEQARDLWMAVTKEKFGIASRGFYITRVRGLDQDPERAICWALNHMFKYVSKPPAVTPGRLASLILAFDGARRVHSLGLFFGKKSKREKQGCPCPKCRAMGILSAISFEGRVMPNGACIPRLEQIEVLRREGYVPLREAGREAVLGLGGLLQDSVGESP